MKEEKIIGYVYNNKNGSIVNTVLRSLPVYTIAENCGHIYVYRVNSAYNGFWFCLGTPKTEIKRDRLINNWVENKRLYFVNDKAYDEILRKNPGFEKIKEVESVQSMLVDIQNRIKQLDRDLSPIVNNDILSVIKQLYNDCSTVYHKLDGIL